MSALTPLQRRAAVGDTAVLVVMTVVGFATHLTLGDVGRMFITGLAALAAWAAVAGPMGAYRVEVIENPHGVWRVAWAWTIAAPLATFLRAVVLARDIPPVFVVVVILTNGFALMAWRLYLGWSLARSYRSGSRSTNSPR